MSPVHRASLQPDNLNSPIRNPGHDVLEQNANRIVSYTVYSSHEYRETLPASIPFSRLECVNASLDHVGFTDPSQRKNPVSARGCDHNSPDVEELRDGPLSD
jgi:hypothetical protein